MQTITFFENTDAVWSFENANCTLTYTIPRGTYKIIKTVQKRIVRYNVRIEVLDLVGKVYSEDHNVLNMPLHAIQKSVNANMYVIEEETA